MKKIVLALLLITLASVGIAQACGDSIYDIQTTPALVGTLGVPCDVIVTATRSNGFFGQQVTTAVNPNGEYSGIWVYTGTDMGYVPGDIISVCGEIKEYYDLTEIDVPAAGLYGYTLMTGSGAPLAPHIVDAATVAAHLPAVSDRRIVRGYRKSGRESVRCLFGKRLPWARRGRAVHSI